MNTTLRFQYQVSDEFDMAVFASGGSQNGNGKSRKHGSRWRHGEFEADVPGSEEYEKDDADHGSPVLKGDADAGKHVEA